MRILLNGNWCEICKRNLPGTLLELGFENMPVATAVNGEFVPVASRPTTILGEGDRLDVVAPMQGG